ncbi:MAG TPA: aspartate aminotransferase [Phycisphaerales bacterium]|nr:MAG: aspartate aminotransferase [Planctomycetes bacterium GWC2_45_44]HBG78005.1 aspartate aminotransferase [Phycisphaerales bacterium]HBR19641.1 aspartate aminotransferase [Phycisphaerales bacterium]
MKYLADRTSLIDASGIRKVFNLAATMKDPINFSIGQPDYDVPDALKQVAIDAIKQGKNRYTTTAGDAELLAKIAKKTTAETGWQTPAALVASGVSGALLLAFMATINPGDEVIIPDPYFVMYKHLVNLLGGKCVFVDTYPDFALHPQKIADKITDKTKLIIINSPCNPTGAVYSKADLTALAEIARKKEILVLSDEIYDQFCYDGPYQSMAPLYENTILMRGFSKSYAMTGWRLAYVAAPAHLKPIVEEMIKIQQYTFVCAPAPFQQAANAALDFDISNYIADYKTKRDILYAGLKDKFQMVKSAGAFYAFIKSPMKTSTEFVEKAIKNNVLIIPGNVFSEKDTHFRLCFTTTNDRLQKGSEILKSIANSQ